MGEQGACCGPNPPSSHWARCQHWGRMLQPPSSPSSKGNAATLSGWATSCTFFMAQKERARKREASAGRNIITGR